MVVVREVEVLLGWKEKTSSALSVIRIVLVLVGVGVGAAPPGG